MHLDTRFDRQYLQRDGSKAAESRLSAHLSIYLLIYLYTRRIFVSVRYAFSHRDSYSLKTFHINSPGPNEDRLRLKPLSGGRGEGAG